ncbi:acetyltransferase [Lacticaseibacillus rhamnosus]|nr:acetyltransferase [Lacticaseibacillus rhamnosus]
MESKSWRSGGGLSCHDIHTITRSPAQKPACKDLSRNGQSPAITSEATYIPTSKRASSRSQNKNVN